MDGLISYFPESDVARQLAGGGGCWVAATLTSPSPSPDPYPYGLRCCHYYNWVYIKGLFISARLA